VSEVESEWETSSGLPLSNGVRGDVTFAEFCPNNEITPGMIYLHLSIVPFEDDKPAEAREQYYSCGEGWEAAEKGKTLVNGLAGTRKVSSNSNLGRLMNAVKKIPGALDALKGSPLRADTWVGTSWTWEQVTFENKLSKKGESSYPFPAKYLGNVTSGKAASSKTAKSNGKAAPGELSGDLVATLTTLAQANSYEDFVAAALDLPEVAGNKDAENVVIDNAFWQSVQA